MAGFMDSLNKGIATINVKTSNMMETTKIKTAISTREGEISALKVNIGETVYINRANFNMNMVSSQIAEIEKKYAEIEELKVQMSKLEDSEKEILGAGTQTDNTPKIFCAQCGAPNKVGFKFCEKCGSPLEA